MRILPFIQIAALAGCGPRSGVLLEEHTILSVNVSFLKWVPWRWQPPGGDST
jgi:hypothetical protein